MTLNLFYQEPEPDRWFKFDRYPRKVIRRLIRGQTRPGGVMMIALELMRGLDRLGIPYRYNDFDYIKKNPSEIACILGKPHLLDKLEWPNPIIFGAGVFSHPVESPNLLQAYPTIKKVLVPGPWMKDMFEPYYGSNVVISWPVGIDTDKWRVPKKSQQVDFLIYNKISGESFEKEMLSVITDSLESHGFNYEFITYGKYTHDDLKVKLERAKSAIFLSKSETQGIAYQQILSTDTPILAWDEQDFWKDPYYYPHKVLYKPVSSVPYWDSRCGIKFTNKSQFGEALSKFVWERENGGFSPRSFILDNLTLEKCAANFFDIHEEVRGLL